MMRRILLLLPLLAMVPGIAAQQSATSQPISDNSFLIEEAYNQEPGVVQHINTFLRTHNGNWLYTFTQEWPVNSMKHQLSYTLSGIRVDQEKGLGDTAINYRYQLVNNRRVSVSPRISVFLPTGSSTRGLGFGGVGIQSNLPVSVTHSDKIVTHWNAGLTVIPAAKNELGEKATTTGFNLGQSTVWLMKPRFNVLVETVWNSFQTVVSKDHTQTGYSFLINPGIRWAYNFKSGLQIVPGVSVPIGVGPSWREHSIFLYLSFEHPFKKVAKE